MAFLIAAVVVIGVLGVVNLLLCLRIARRVRDNAGRLDRLDRLGRVPATLATMLEPGRTVGAFQAVTVDGQEVTGEDLADTTLVGFFATDCEACDDRLPEFVAYAEEHPGGWSRVLAVVIAPDAAAAEPLITRLIGVARVVQAPVDEIVLRTAFGVRGCPAFGLIGDGGVVRASGDSVAALSSPAAGRTAPDDRPRGPKARPEVRRV